jgi:hypothetical protein
MKDAENLQQQAKLDGENKQQQKRNVKMTVIFLTRIKILQIVLK